MNIGALEFIQLLVFIVILFAIRWIRVIKNNSEKQVEQNEQIITLLKKEVKY